MLGQEGGNGFRCVWAHVNGKVVVSGIVTRGVGEGLGIVLASLVDLVNQFGRSFLINASTLGETPDAHIAIGYNENANRIGVILEDMETRAAHKDARLLLGQIAHDLCFGIKELARGNLLVLWLIAIASGAKLAVKLTEIVPKVLLLLPDALYLL